MHRSSPHRPRRRGVGARSVQPSQVPNRRHRARKRRGSALLQPAPQDFCSFARPQSGDPPSPKRRGKSVSHFWAKHWPGKILMISFVVSKNLTKIWHRNESASGNLAQERVGVGQKRQRPTGACPGQGAGTKCKATGWSGHAAGAWACSRLVQGSPGQGAQAGRGFQRSHGKGAERGIVTRGFKGEKGVNEMRNR